MIKLKNINIKNLGAIQNIEIEFDDKITRLVGVNGSGKTSVLNAIWAAFKGIAQKGSDYLIAEKFRMLYPGSKSADIYLTLIDESKGAKITIKRHFTKDTNTITFDAPKGYPVDDRWLTGLLNVSLMSANKFTSMTGKEQALALGVDVSEFNEKIDTLKDDAKGIRRDISSCGELIPVEKTEKIVVSELLKERDKIIEFNDLQREREQKIEEATNLITEINTENNEIEAQIRTLKEKLTKNEARIKKGKEYADKLEVPEPEKTTDEVDEKMKGAENTNEKALLYERYIEEKTAKEQKEAELQKNLYAQKEVQAEKNKYMQSQKFGVEGITVDESGGLLCDGKLIRSPYFSTGELEMKVASLASSLNPELKVRFIDGFEALDDKNQTKIIEDLTGAGFQVIVTEFGNKREKENTVLLKDCTVFDKSVKEYE